MPTRNPRSPAPTFLQRMLHAYAPLRESGKRTDPVPHLPHLRTIRNGTRLPQPQNAHAQTRDLPVGLFVMRLRELIAAESESARRKLEEDVLKLAVPLKAAGVFDVLQIAHPALASMVADHLEGTLKAKVEHCA